MIDNTSYVHKQTGTVVRVINRTNTKVRIESLRTGQASWISVKDFLGWYKSI